MKYWFLIIWLSFKWIFRINVGDYIWYEKKKYVVSNGVVPGGWRLSGLKNDHDGWVKREECRKSLTITNLIGSFRSGYRFYMGYWFSIWKNGGTKDWMRKCHIW